jgi:ribosomal protein S27E
LSSGVREEDTRVKCLACGHRVDLDDACDDYEGPVRCLVCGTILEIPTEQGRIKAVRQVNAVRHPSPEEGSSALSTR